jgi:transcriptional regulator with PAS, ATPase and Fis domain
MIDVPDLPAHLHAGAASPSSRETSGPPAPAVGALEEQERLLVIRALETSAGNQSQAARLLRIGRDALRYKLKKYNL